MKTLTLLPRKGNLTFWRPWRAVRLVPGGAINSVGLTNPGVHAWCSRYADACARHFSGRTIMSVMAESADEMRELVRIINLICRDFVIGIEANVSCVNTGHATPSPTLALEMFEAAKKATDIPIGVKLAWQDDYLTLARLLDGDAAWIHACNTVPFAKSTLASSGPSPLAKYGYEGGVSGTPIQDQSLECLRNLRDANLRSPILSGGGVMSADDARERFRLGADAVSIGTLFLRRPWMPDRIQREIDGEVE